jgi:hypothetical protein
MTINLHVQKKTIGELILVPLRLKKLVLHPPLLSLLEWRSGIRHGQLYPRAGTSPGLGPPEPTTIRP